MKTEKTPFTSFPIMEEKKFNAELFTIRKDGVEENDETKVLFCRISTPETLAEFEIVRDFAKKIFNKNSILPRIYNSMANEETKQKFIDGLISIFAESEIFKDAEISPEKLKYYDNLENENKALKEYAERLREGMENLKNAIVIGAVDKVLLREAEQLKIANKYKGQKPLVSN